MRSSPWLRERGRVGRDLCSVIHVIEQVKVIKGHLLTNLNRYNSHRWFHHHISDNDISLLHPMIIIKILGSGELRVIT